LKQPQFLVTAGDDYISSLEPKVIIAPIPYEHTSSYGHGSVNGPRAILEASHFVEYYDEELKLETIRKIGVKTLQELDLRSAVNEEALNLIEQHASNLLKENVFLVTLGGEHTVSYPIFKAMNQKFENLSVLQLDAHSDLRPSYEGNKFSHASVMARIRELGPNIAQLGIRALCKEEAGVIDSDQNIETVFAHDLSSGYHVADRLIDHLSENVYVTIDADGFDPRIIPGTGTPEPGGLEWYPTLNFLRKVFTEKNVVGFDVVECCPRENEIISEFTLAKLVYKLIGYRYLNKKYKI
jgi:agmatinase